MGPRNEELASVWDEAIAAMRASGLEPSSRLLDEIAASIRGEMDIETIFRRVLARASGGEDAPRVADPSDIG